jgi:hypothetical protein
MCLRLRLPAALKQRSGINASDHPVQFQLFKSQGQDSCARLAGVAVAARLGRKDVTQLSGAVLEVVKQQHHITDHIASEA